jgi:hypothetical protein
VDDEWCTEKTPRVNAGRVVGRCGVTPWGNIGACDHLAIGHCSDRALHQALTNICSISDSAPQCCWKIEMVLRLSPAERDRSNIPATSSAAVIPYCHLRECNDQSVQQLGILDHDKTHRASGSPVLSTNIIREDFACSRLFG